MPTFDQIVKGSSANTAGAVLRLGNRKREVSLLLPLETDLTTVDGLRQLNERLRQIEENLRRIEEAELQLAVKFGFGALDPVPATATPVPGAKVTLDKIGTWLILVTSDWRDTGSGESFVVVDPETTEGAKKQDALCRVTGEETTTAWCLFTATTVPRLAQLYAKTTDGAQKLDEAGTAIAAVWVARWRPGDKRFGRHIPSQYTGAEDMNNDPLTDHGEEARWPLSDHPDKVAHGVDQAGL